ncbi:MAG TPA: hypothetical protein VMB50_15490 [Myxococcales bacterium]|nr:hypothetical protein [Myxococcales bacterium]
MPLLALALALGLSGNSATAGGVPPAALGIPLPAPAPAEQVEPPVPPEPPPEEAAAEASPPRHVASWVLLGLGGVGLLTGGAFNLAAASAANGNPTALATGAPNPTPQSNGLWAGAIISYSVGAALGLAGAVVYYVESKH